MEIGKDRKRLCEKGKDEKGQVENQLACYGHLIFAGLDFERSSKKMKGVPTLRHGR